MKNPTPELIARYLAGNCTEEEKIAIKKWERDNQSNQELLNNYIYLWQKASDRYDVDKTTFNTKEGWHRLQRAMEETEASSKLNDSNKRTYFTNRSKIRGYRYAAIAAVMLIVLVTGYITYQNWNAFNAPSPEPKMQEIVTQNGQRTHITLSDGTNILLNADSRLRVPAIFKGDKRKVYLQGQAYFEVTENPEKPFVIYVDGTVVKVLGTSFSVRAYPEDHQINVVVKNGRVAFRANPDRTEPSAVVTTNEMVRFNRLNDHIVTRKVDNLNLYLGWIDGSLNFDHTSMQEVAIDLERRYGVQVTFHDPVIKQMVLTAHLKSKMIQNVLDVIAVSLNINYKLNGDKVIFLN